MGERLPATSAATSSATSSATRLYPRMILTKPISIRAVPQVSRLDDRTFVVVPAGLLRWWLDSTGSGR